MAIENNAIRRIYFKVGREGVACDVNGLTPTSSQPTYHHTSWSPTITSYHYIQIFGHTNIIIGHTFAFNPGA